MEVFACLEFPGLLPTTYFTGQANGLWRGQLGGELADGTGCAGEWTTNAARVEGAAAFLCEDGTAGEFLFSLSPSGAAEIEGGGRTGDGRWIKAWTGSDLDRFRDDAGVLNALRACVNAPLKVSAKR